MSECTDLETPIWGVAAIASVINRSQRQTKHLIATGNLPVGKVGDRYFSTRKRLRDWLESRISNPA